MIEAVGHQTNENRRDEKKKKTIRDFRLHSMWLMCKSDLAV